jgi:hypothetical protein
MVALNQQLRYMKKNKHTIDGTEDFPEFEEKVDYAKYEKVGEPAVRSRMDRGGYVGDNLRQASAYLKIKHQEQSDRDKLLRNIAIIIAIATSLSAVMMIFSAIGG